MRKKEVKRSWQLSKTRYSKLLKNQGLRNSLLFFFPKIDSMKFTYISGPKPNVIVQPSPWKSQLKIEKDEPWRRERKWVCYLTKAPEWAIWYHKDLIRLTTYGDLDESNPVGAYVWLHGPQLVELIGRDWEVWPHWRRCFTEGGLWSFEHPWRSQLDISLHILGVYRSDISSELPLQPPWLPATMFPTVMITDSNPLELRVFTVDIFFISCFGCDVLSRQYKVTKIPTRF